ncbi:MAG: hypothetical protein CMJ93_00840 [Planctomycetes bacterium]|nr:hypothetical protein [Planctomycetota bacterium]
MEKRSVPHVDLDAFCVLIEFVPALSLCGTPVMVGGSSQQRARTAIANELREKYAVSSFNSGCSLWMSD